MDSMKTNIILLIVYILNVIDYFFTTYWVQMFGVEAELNPIGQWMFENNITWFFKLIVVGGVIALIGYLIKNAQEYLGFHTFYLSRMELL